jgi:hypothetical protein
MGKVNNRFVIILSVDHVLSVAELSAIALPKWHAGGQSVLENP